MTRLSRYFAEESFLIIILVVGAVMRFFGFADFSYSNDELSAITRAMQPTFHDLVVKGFFVDGHPGGVEVLLFYWIRLGGTAETWVRLPFVLSGILSIWAAYWVSKRWFGKITGLFTAATIAFLQIFILWSQVARPYAPGLFFTLMAVGFWTRLLFPERPSKKKTRWFALGLALFMALSMYTHYFAFLLVVILAAIGLFFIRKSNYATYLAALLLALLLFLPHGSITLNHLQFKGVGEWLSAPDSLWLFRHMFNLWNQSYLLISFVILWILLACLANYKSIHYRLFHTVSLLLFILPFLIGFVYSRRVNPVLQDSVLLFSAPYLIMLIFSVLPQKFGKLPRYILMIYLFFGVVDSSFIQNYYSRQHFGEFRGTAKALYDWNLRCSSDNTSIALVANNPYYVNFYARRWGPDLKFVQTDNRGGPALKELRKKVRQSVTDYFAYAWTKPAPDEIESIITEKYPYVLERREFGGLSAAILYGKRCYTGLCEEEKVKATLLNDFEGKDLWGADSSLLYSLTKHSGNYAIALGPDQEYGPTLKSPLKDMGGWPFHRLRIACWADLGEDLTEANLVVAMEDEQGKPYGWSAMNMLNFLDPGDSGIVYFSYTLPEGVSPHDKISIYVWNTSRGKLRIDDFKINLF